MRGSSEFRSVSRARHHAVNLTTNPVRMYIRYQICHSCITYVHKLIETRVNNHNQNPASKMSSNRTITKIKYGPHERQRITHYHSTTNSASASSIPLIFIHGGAWLDSTNTDSDFDDFGSSLLTTESITDIYSIDYRLSPEIQRPNHLNDIIQAMKTLSLGSKHQKINLSGHSVGVTMVLELIMKIMENKKEEKELFGYDLQVEKVYLLDGIYQVQLFKQEYPKWAFFIKDAGYEDYTIDFTNLKSYLGATADQIYIVQSFQDELLSMKQTNWFIEKLNEFQIGYCLKVGDFGKHDEVYHNEEVAQFINKSYK
ncbi:hypothetical protein WICPIJ_008405 [Wickerhamomyces pijperi]|uniref:Alpha/beta hydrolase fold-3 domain-containing protein n=1 Tax=Wickerhamomyces pijperi TaxID=599730 RepID=A0A9P8PX61_WICPI|nr:hypothetical protein WICPIJ_008405 [Wickerhamomyces pijperi]